MSLPRYSQYKDSGVAWLGEMPAHWRITKTKHVCQFSTGWTPPTGDSSAYEGDNLWANISDLGPKVLRDTAKRISDSAVANASINISPAGSLLFSFKLSVGQVSIAGVDLYTNEAIATFHESSSLGIRYAYYAFPTFLVKNASENIYGAKLLNQELIKAAFIPLPPLDEQDDIATFLDRETAKIDALIAEQEKLLALLAEKRQATISHAVTRGLNPNASMRDSGIPWLGEVPAHWLIGGLTKFIGPVVDYRGRTPAKGDAGTFLVTAKNVRNGAIDYAASEEYVDPVEANALLSRGRPEVGDVLFTTEAPLGQVAQIDRTEIALAQRIVKFRGLEGVLINRFLMYWLMGSACQSRLETLATGSTALGIKASKLGMIECLVPPIPEQQKIVGHIDRQLSKFTDLEVEAVRGIDLLRERRSALISAAVTGKIDVRGAV